MDREADGLLAPGQRLVCIGDSITADELGYVSIARAIWALRGAGVEVVNAGVGGDTGRQMRARFERDVLAHEPHWVSLMVGMADTIKHLWGDAEACPDLATHGSLMDDMIELAVSAGARVALCTPSHMESFGHGQDIHEQGHAMLSEKSAWLRARAASGGHLLVPTGEVLRHAKAEATAGGRCLMLTDDGVHLNELGRALTGVAFVSAFGYDLDVEDVAGATRSGAGA